MVYDEINKKFKLEKEFFVSDKFGTNDDFNHLDTFVFSNSMLYANNETYLLQERRAETTLDEEIKITEPQKFKERTSAFPLCSNKFVLKVIDSERKTNTSGRMKGSELYLSPPSNSQKAASNSSFSPLDIEYFLHSDPTKLARIKRLYFEVEENERKFRLNLQVEIEFALINGLRVGKTYHLPETASEEIIEVLVSQSGEFLTLVTVKRDDIIGIHKYHIAPREGDQRIHEDINTEGEEVSALEDPDGRVRTDLHLQKDAINTQKDFTVVKIEDYVIEKVSRKSAQGGRWKTTDYGSVIFINLKDKLFFVDLDNLYQEVAGRIGRYLKAHSDDLDIPAEKVCIGDRYVILWHHKKLICLKAARKRNEYQIESISPNDSGYADKVMRNAVNLVDEVKEKSQFGIDKIISIGHEPIVDYRHIELKHMVATSHPSRVLFIYKIKNGYNAFIWDIERNKEIDSFASRESDTLLFYAQPPKQQVYEGLINSYIKNESKIRNRDNSKKTEGEQITKEKKDEADEEKGYFLSHTGYLVFDNYFVNLTTMIPSPFIKLDGRTDKIIYPNIEGEVRRKNDSELWEMGPRFNYDETCLVINGNIYHAYSYQDIFFRIKREYDATKSIQASKYFIGRRSVISDLITDEYKLYKIFDHFKEDRIMIAMMLVQDNKGKTPFEEAIDNNSPKIVEMLLEYTQDIAEFKLSKMFYKRFDALFDLGIETFRGFLNTCYFSTPQMAMMKKTENKGAKGIIRHGVSCSMLPESLNKEYLIDQKIDNHQDDDIEGDAYGNDFGDSFADVSNEDRDEEDDEESLASDFNPEEQNEKSNEKQGSVIKNTKIKAERRIEVKGIEFDWLFTEKEGKRFMEKLSETEDLSYYELDIVKNIIWFQWNKFLPGIIIVLFTPFLIFFSVFIAYTTWVIQEKNEENEDWGPWATTAFILAMITLGFQVFFFLIEIHQFYFHKMHYLKSFWNVLD